MPRPRLVSDSTLQDLASLTAGRRTDTPRGAAGGKIYALLRRAIVDVAPSSLILKEPPRTPATAVVPPAPKLRVSAEMSRTLRQTSRTKAGLLTVTVVWPAAVVAAAEDEAPDDDVFAPPSGFVSGEEPQAASRAKPPIAAMIVSFMMVPPCFESLPCVT